MKTCTLCKDEKPPSDFNRNAGRKDGLQNHCRECGKHHAKTYYQNNKSVMIPMIIAKAKERARKHQQLLIKYLLTHPCVDCGEADIVVLDFDHVSGTKTDNITSMLGRRGFAWAVIESEIAKCEVRCANCHRRKTAKERGYYREMTLP